jgi:hypothetical protein
MLNYDRSWILFSRPKEEGLNEVLAFTANDKNFSLAFLRLMVNLFSLRLTEILEINYHCFK